MNNKIIIEFCPIKPMSYPERKKPVYWTPAPEPMYHVVWSDGKNVGSLQMDEITLRLFIKLLGYETNSKVLLEEFCGKCPNISHNKFL